MDPFSISGKNIIVTGATSDIGRDCALKFDELNANVILLGRNDLTLKPIYSELRGKNKAKFIHDLNDFEGYSKLIKNIVDTVGPISGFVHSAGNHSAMPLTVLDNRIIEADYRINTVSFFEFVRYLSKKKNTGEEVSYIAISSIMSILGKEGLISYCSAKGALTNGIKALALELSRRSIRVNSISPAIVETRMIKEFFSTIPNKDVEEILGDHPLGFGSTDDIANACIFLLSSASKWITGSNLVVDGGYSAK